jgi:Na+/melibiose symporter-like transporter
LFNASLGGSEIGTNLAILLFGLGNGYLGSAIWHSYSACVQTRRPHQMGLLFGIFTAAAKVSLALCGLIIGLVLARYDYAGAQPAIITKLITVMPLLGSLCCILAGAYLWRRGRQGLPNLTAPDEA